nr:MAG TPA: hypothetical protein [Caudoviricetes sp.]
MCDLLARRLLPCVLIRNQFSDLFFVVFTTSSGIKPPSL